MNNAPAPHDNNPPLHQEPVAAASKGLAEGVAKALSKGASLSERLVQARCLPGEKCLGFQRGETRLHFLIRIIPFAPDFFTRPRRFLLAITDRRVLIIEVTNPLNKLKEEEFKRLVASLPFGEIASVEPVAGLLASEVKIVTTSGQRHRFRNML